MEWADSWVANNQPSILHELENAELAHRLRFENDYGRGIQQFYVEFGALVDAVDDVNFAERDHWPPFRYVQFVLLAKNLGSLHSAMDRLSRGFYQDALSLTRSSYDAWLRLVFISCYPDDPYAALMHRTPKGTPSFNATDLVRVQLRLDWLSKYRIMSAFAHGNSVDALQSLQAAIERSGDPERFGLQQSYDVSRIELVYPFLEFLVLAYLRFVVERLLAPGSVAFWKFNRQVAVEAVDLQVGRLWEATRAAGGVLLVTADHGNADEMWMREKKTGQVKLDAAGRPLAKPSHTLAAVPFVLCDETGTRTLADVPQAGIASVGGTILALLGLDPPPEYAPALVKAC